MPRTQRPIMAPTELKSLLRRARERPVSCAITTGGDVPHILLHRSKAPEAVLRDLRSQVPDAGKVLYGTARVNGEDDPKKVVFTMNTTITGLELKLVRSLKGLGYDGARFSSQEDDSQDAAAADSSPTPSSGAPGRTRDAPRQSGIS
jgi:hypothetical protein